MTIADFPVTYADLKSFFTQFENVAGVSGKAGNIGGRIVAAGNRFEGPRSSEYPLPPLKNVYGDTVFAQAAEGLGYEPFSILAANASQPYTNPYGVRMGPCNFCGFCEGYGCYMYAKASPQSSILLALITRRAPALT